MMDIMCLSIIVIKTNIVIKMFGDICRGWEPYIIVEVSLSHGRLYILPFYFNENIKSQTKTQNKHTSASHKMKRFFQ